MTRWILLALLASAPASAEEPRAGEPAIVDVAPDDPEMTAAIAGARAHLGVFRDRLAAPSRGDSFVVKKPFQTDGRVEHMWLANPRAVSGGFVGKLNNVPRDATWARMGRRYFVAEGDVSDWMIIDASGRLHGGYTLRVLLDELPPAEREGYERRLAPLPE